MHVLADELTTAKVDQTGAHMDHRNKLRRLRRIALDRGLYIESRPKTAGLFHLVNLDTCEPFPTPLKIEEIEAFLARGGSLSDALIRSKGRV